MGDPKPENNSIDQEENPSTTTINNPDDSSNNNDEENPSTTASNNPNDNSNNNVEEIDDGGGGGAQRRTPFADLSQVDADLALASTLQEQERAYMMLRMNAGEGIDYGSWEAESYGNGDEGDDDDFDDPSEEEYDGSEIEEDENEEEDAFDVNEHNEEEVDVNQNVEIDPSAYSSDEAYARALQDAEEMEMAARLLSMAGINEMLVGEADDEEDLGGNSQEAWEEVDPDELSYEELVALGEVVGTENRGLSADTIASLPVMKYKSQCTEDRSSDSCVICRFDYEEGETLTVLSCKHSYHSECIKNWLQINKVCPVCSAEVSTSGKS